MRRFGRPAKGLAAAFLAYGLFGFFGVPKILRWQVPRMCRSYLAREATLRSASFNPFTLRTRLDGFDLRDKDGSPLASFDRLDVDLQSSSLFRRAWTFRRIRLVRPKVLGRIATDGRPAVADLLEPKAGAPQPGKEFKLPRALIQDLDIDSGTVTFHDASADPAFESTWEPLNVRVSGLSTIPDRSGDHVITVGIEGRGEARWSGRMSMQPLRLEGRLDLALRHVDRAWQYGGRAYPIVVTSGESHISLPYLIEKRADGVLRFEAHDVTFDATDLAARPRDASDDWVRIAKVDLTGGRVLWPERSAEAAAVRITKPSANVWRAEDRKVNWLEWFDRFKEAGANAKRDAVAAPPWKGVCHVVDVTGGSFHVEDRAVTPKSVLTVSELTSHVENVTSEPSSPLTTRISATVNGSATTTTVGTVVIRPPAVDVAVEFSGFEINALQPYLSEYSRAQLQSGAVSLNGRLVYRDGGKPVMSFEGRTALDGFSLADPDGRPVLSWSRMAVENIRLALAPNRFGAKSIALNKLFGQILIDKDRKLGLLKLFKEKSDAPPAAATAPETPGAPFPFEIASIRLHDAEVDYGDESLILPFRTRIHAAEGSLTDLSSKSAGGSRLAFEGRVDEHGTTKTEGTLRVFDPYAASDIHVGFRNVEMNTLTPYTAEFAGYSIKEGRLDLAVDYQIHNRALLGNHKLTATQLTLGPKVDGAKTSLPLRLAVALLKDSQGKIDVEVPIEGSVDDPEFGYRKVIWTAFKQIMVNVTTAPFRFLGRMMGVKGDDLEMVSFDAGRSVLLPPEQEKLQKLVEALKSRPELVLQVGGRFDQVSDTAALRVDKLDALIASRRESMGDADIDAVLEALYLESHSPEEREALRQKHTSAPDSPPTPAPPAKTKRGKKPAPPPPPGFDAAGYFDEMRTILLEAQAVGDEDLAALAQARSAGITAALTGEGGIETARVTATEVQPVKKNEGQSLVPCQLAMPVD
jgi:hypothetical protein